VKKIIPIILALIGIGSGIGAGFMLRPDPTEMTAINPCGEVPQVESIDHTAEEETPDKAVSTSEFVKLNNQFVVPIVSEERIEAMVVLSLSVEVAVGNKEAVYRVEPKLRDAFLQVLFDHANNGGFRGAFTNSNTMKVLRNALNETAHKVMGDVITDVLIMDIARQDN